MDEIIKEIGVKVDIREIRKVGEKTERGRGEMLLIKLGNEEQNWEIMGEKKNLRWRKERVSEDLTWREKTIRWKLKQIARKKEAEGKKAWIKDSKIRLDG